MFTYQKIIDAVSLVVFVPSFIAALLLVLRHGAAKRDGWLLLGMLFGFIVERNKQGLTES